ncbi:response regulator transcription factor [Paenibacillus wulumuqiensis]|uniref:response regulator transcription factor n=1 Tax=Paenibacillus wulumuqiensis TaxID=1567107 RepID=UPI00061958C6|nr:response regulator transcription factor [Paenibacillus wulumuqiensis]
MNESSPALSARSIVIIDDEPDITDLLTTVLHKEGFRHIHIAHTGWDGIRLCRERQPDIIILDIMLPDQDGFAICQQLRQFTHVPIFFLSAKNEDMDKIIGLGIGGDDYITKPFSPRELAYRIKARFRRDLMLSGTIMEQRPVYEYGNIRIDENKGEVIRDSVPVSLTAKEYKLLLVFAAHPDQIFSKQQLYKKVWEEDYMGSDNAIMVHIRHLREKLEEDPSNPQRLLTIRGLGYKWSSRSRES